jgi:uncharacterized membrane protein
MTKMKIISATIVILCLFGLAISIYLYRLDLKVEAQSTNPQTFQTLETAPCDINAIISCSTVAKSEYSEIANIKVALLGIIGYVALLILYAVFLISRNTKLIYLFAATAFFGTAFSTYLTYLEFAVIKAVCPWCMVSYVLMLAILGLGMYLTLHFRKQDKWIFYKSAI